MKILFLTPQLPYPPRQGTQIRNYHVIKAAATAHRVDLISFARPGEILDPSWGDPNGVGQGLVPCRSVQFPLPLGEGRGEGRGEGGPPLPLGEGRGEGRAARDKPPPYDGATLRDLCGQIRLLPAPARSQWARLRALATSPEPDMAQRLLSRGFAATLRSVAANGGYDSIQVEGIELARYVPIARAAAPNAAVVFDDHNAEYLLQARAALVDARRVAALPKALYSLIQWLKLRRYEARVCAQADLVLAVSEADAAALRALGTSTPVRVVPNGVDTEYYRPRSPLRTAAGGPDIDPRGRLDPDSFAIEGLGPLPPTLLFTGTMDYRPNVDAMQWFVSSVFPAILARKPDARLLIVGRSPARAVLRLAEVNPSVTVTGPVEDVRPYFRRGTVFVVPIRMAGGVRLKILEALAMGLPVVSTPVGAEGTDLADGSEALVAEQAGHFAAAVLRLLDDPALRGQLALAGRRAAEERHGWTSVAPRLLEAYQGLEMGRRGDGEMGRQGEKSMVPPSPTPPVPPSTIMGNQT